MLLAVVLGGELAAEWVPLLESYYADARRRSPATFLDFDRAWDLQRRRWQPLVDDAEADARPVGPADDSLSPTRGPDRTAAVPGRQGVAGRSGRRPSPSRRAGVAAAGAAAGCTQADLDAGLPPSSGSGFGAALAGPEAGDDPASDVDPELADGEPVAPLPPLPAEPDDADSDSDAALARRPQVGRCGLAVVEAARRRDFDLITVFDGCLSELDGEPHWESFRFGAASLHRGPLRRSP